MKIKIVNIEKTRRSGTQVGQNETRLTPREASKSKSQKIIETTVAPREASCQLLPLSLVMFSEPAQHRGKLQKANFKHRCKKPHL